ncbi:unnamed protein product [Closterium sp. NIES-65]|nr:unnamed protein product [Closterium sp. NIES-65]
MGAQRHGRAEAWARRGMGAQRHGRSEVPCSPLSDSALQSTPLIPSSISPPFPALPFLLPFPVHPSRSPSHPPFPPIFQSPPHCPSLSPPSYSPLSSTFPFHSPIPPNHPPPPSPIPPTCSPPIPPSFPLPTVNTSNLQPCAGLLTNHEVFELLTDRGAMGAVDVSQGGMGPAAIECQVYTYLCAAPAATQTRAAVAKCTERAATFGLTRMETLQLVNLRPSQPVEAHLIIADCEMRLPGERVEQLLQVVEETLPAAPELEGGAEEEEGG